MTASTALDPQTLRQLLAHPAFAQHLAAFQPGDVLCREGDASRELYVLVSGALDIYKGDQLLAKVDTPGAPIGEISYLLEAPRTATVRAAGAVQALCIPADAITDLFRELPELARHVARILAARLDRASRIVHGFQEFCEQLPDAVVVTDQQGRILTWNSAAVEVYGRPAEEMLDRSIASLYDDAASWERVREDVRAGRVVREEVLLVQHPGRGPRSVSTSATLLYDGHHNVQGVLYLGRDVSEALRLGNRYRRVRNWTLPLLGLLTCAAVAGVVGYPRLARDPAVLSIRQSDLQDQVRRDARLLASLLAAPLRSGDHAQLNALLGEFLTSQASGPTPYLGLAVLDPRKQVVAAAAREAPEAARAMLGSSYAGIAFRGDEGSPHRMLTVYRPDPQHPLGAKGIEMAFPIADPDGGGGWVLLQFDTARLRHDYRIDERQLERFRL